MRHFIITSLSLIFFTSCSLTRKAAISTTSGMLYKASFEVENQRDWNFMKNSMPSNLLLMESLLHLSPGDQDLLLSLLKGHFAYGFGVYESLYLDDFLKDVENSSHKKNALIHYSKSIQYALRYLEEEGVEYATLKKKVSVNNGVKEYLNDKLSSSDLKDLEAVLFFAQSLGGSINLQKSDMEMVGELPLVKEMFDWVCSARSDINFGVCDLFYGMYDASRPRMLGGNPERGKKTFKNFIEKMPENYLGRVAYLQFYVIPMSDEEEYQVQKEKLLALKRKFEREKIFSPSRGKDNILDRLRIYQSIAFKRFEIILKHEKEIF